MRNVLIVLAALAAITTVSSSNLVVQAADQADFLGTWNGSLEQFIEGDPAGAGEVTMTLARYGDSAVRGNWSSVDRFGATESGTVLGIVRENAASLTLVNPGSGLHMAGFAELVNGQLAGSYVGIFPNSQEDRVDGRFSFRRQ